MLMTPCDAAAAASIREASTESAGSSFLRRGHWLREPEIAQVVEFEDEMYSEGDAKCIHAAIEGRDCAGAAFVLEGLRSLMMPEIGLADQRQGIENEVGCGFARTPTVALYDGLDHAVILQQRTGARAKDTDRKVYGLLETDFGDSVRSALQRPTAGTRTARRAT